MKALSKELAELQHLQALGAVQIDPAKVPASRNFKRDDPSLQNLLRGLMKGHKDLEDLSEQALTSMVDQIHQQPNVSQPEHFVTAPTVFGSCSLEAKDLDALRTFRKDSRESCNIETTLKFLKKYHSSQSHRFTEASLIEALHVLLPAKSLNLLHSLIEQELSLAEIFTSLSHTFGETKTESDLVNQLYTLTEGNRSALEILQEIDTLINQSPSSYKMLNCLGLNEAKRLVKRELGSHPLATLEAFFSMGATKTFREFHRLVLVHFGSDLKNKKSKAHHVEQEALSAQIAELKQMIDQQQQAEVNQVKDNSEKSCFTCKQKGHFARDCRLKQAPSARSQGPSYCDSPCSLHTNGSHNNRDCRSQLGPCQHRPNHQNHTMGHCRRPVNQQHSRPSGPVLNQQPGWNRQTLATKPSNSPAGTSSNNSTSRADQVNAVIETITAALLSLQ